MGEIRIALPDKLHRKVKAKAANNGFTMKKFVVKTLWEAVFE